MGSPQGKKKETDGNLGVFVQEFRGYLKSLDSKVTPRLELAYSMLGTAISKCFININFQILILILVCRIECYCLKMKELAQRWKVMS